MRRVTERLSATTLLLLVIAAVIALAMGAGYLVGKLIV
jgi:hypothetical protein